MVRVRFAPSPTGLLHVGGARTALFNYVFARKHGGKFILRIEDTDRERSTKENEEDIKKQLRWLGMHWDEGPDIGGSSGPYFQSQRIDKHLATADELIRRGKAYKDDGGAVRFRYPKENVVVNDSICGDCVFSTDNLGDDPVILRSNGTPTYHLAVVSDDVEMGITHIVRGQDHLTNAAKHKLMFEALERPVPVFAHLPLILSKDGGKLSKRNVESPVAVREFFDKGYLSQALVNFLMLLGWSHPEALEQFALEDVIDVFSLERINQTSAVFDNVKLDFLNGWWMRHLPAERIIDDASGFVGEFKETLARKGGSYWKESFSTLKNEMSHLTDLPRLLGIVVGEQFSISEAVDAEVKNSGNQEQFVEVIRAWLELLRETEPAEGSDRYDLERFNQLNALLKKKVTAKGKALFQGIRLAIMGTLSGPELKLLVPLISRELLIDRAAFALGHLSS